MSPFEEGVMSDYIPLRVTPNPKLLEEGTAKEEQYKNCKVLSYLDLDLQCSYYSCGKMI